MWKPVLFAALTTTTACAMDGDRLAGGDCPDGETCSGGTPSGLYFQGPTIAGNILSMPPLAVGGTEDVELVDARTSQPLALAYTVDDDGGDAIRVTGTTGPTLHLAGNATGGDLVRILDAGTGELFDRKTIQAQRVGTVGLVSTELTVTRGDLPTAMFHDTMIGVGLYGADTHERLVDAGMTATIPGAKRITFDSLDLTGIAPGPTTVAIALADGTPFAIETAIVDHVDTVEVSPIDVNGDPTPTSLTTQAGTLVCFTPKTGGAFVLGATFTFATDNGTIDATNFLVPNCTQASPATVGTAHITATSEGASITIALPVTDAAARTTRRAPRPTAGTPEGDRAKLLGR